MIDAAMWKGRRVLVTGHTGFKGAWLSLMLARLGAVTTGFALPHRDAPRLYDLAHVADGLDDRRGDICDAAALEAAFDAADPEVVFHLAAQALVKAGYADPVETFRVNTLGTAQCLDAARRRPGVKAVVVVTSDKCYAEQAMGRGYREADRLGGRDPYAGSKACAELVAASFRDSYADHGPVIVTARAGNVVGGGDFAPDRIVPDAVRAFMADRPLMVRNPAAVRPWQHVLEPLCGYLLLAERALANEAGVASGWNFGPDADGERTVETLVTQFAAHWGPQAAWRPDGASHAHEAAVLRLESGRARKAGWRPLLTFAETIDWTCRWYRAYADGADMQAETRAQVEAFLRKRLRDAPLLQTAQG